MNYLTVVAIMRNEELYLSEWHEFHKRQGVEKFILFDNMSTDNTREVACELGEDIILKDWPGQSAQRSAYEYALQEYRETCRWMAFIDIDEFIVPHEVTFKEFLEGFEDFSGLGIHWYLFGSNGKNHWEKGGVVSRFTRRQLGINPHIKSIVDPKQTVGYVSPHRFHHTGTFVDEHKKPIVGGIGIYPEGTCDLIQINHYATKSYEECVERRGRPRPDTGEIREPKSFFKLHDFNDKEDLIAESWL